MGRDYYKDKTTGLYEYIGENNIKIKCIEENRNPKKKVEFVNVNDETDILYFESGSQASRVLNKDESYVGGRIRNGKNIFWKNKEYKVRYV